MAKHISTLFSWLVEFCPSAREGIANARVGPSHTGLICVFVLINATFGGGSRIVVNGRMPLI
jgi:hypothetical protein